MALIEMAQPVSFVQETPASTWVIPHHLGEDAIIDCMVYVDGELTKILGGKVAFSKNQITITWSQPYSGKARIV